MSVWHGINCPFCGQLHAGLPCPSVKGSREVWYPVHHYHGGGELENAHTAPIGLVTDEQAEILSLRAKLQEVVGIAQKFADAARDACIAGLAQSAKLRQAEVRIAELEALVRLLKADAADGTANQHYLDGAEAFADWAAEDNDFPTTDASFEGWKDRGLRALAPLERGVVRVVVRRVES